MTPPDTPRNGEKRSPSYTKFSSSYTKFSFFYVQSWVTLPVNLHKLMKLLQRKTYTDVEVVDGLQRRERNVEEWFYRTARRYFMEKFHEEFFDHTAKEEIFQNSFVKLWTEITSRRIALHGGHLTRTQKDGHFFPLTCSLTTFLMAIARNEYREMVRDNRLTYVDRYFDDVIPDDATILFNEEPDEDRMQRVVAECVGRLSPSCAEILTLFYYEGRSLDEILELRADSGTSKDGLKTRKSKCMNTLRQKINEALSA